MYEGPITKVVHTRTFKNGNSEAVRLPKNIGFGAGTIVTVERVGDVVTITPTPAGTMRDLVETLRKLPDPDGGWARLPVDTPERGSW